MTPAFALRPDLGETYWSLANLKTYRFDDATVARDGASDRGGRTDGAVRSEFPVRARQGVRGSWRFRRAPGISIAKAIPSSAPRSPTTRCRRKPPTTGSSRCSPRSSCVARAAPAIRSRRRSSSWACRAPARRCSSRSSPATRRSRARASCRTSSRSRPGSTAIVPEGDQLSRGGARARAEDFARLGARLPRGYARCIARRQAALHRQDAEQLSEYRPDHADPAEREDHRRPPPSAGCVLLSCYRQLFAKGQAFTYDLTEIGEYYLQYQRMMDHWAQVLPGRVLTVQYEEVVADSRRRCAGCWSSAACRWRRPACLLREATGRCARRAPSRCASRSTIVPSGHWRHYERHLDELTTVIAPLRER